MKDTGISKFYKLLGLAGLLLVTIASEAQTLARHNWYFGNGPQGIRFNRISNSATIVNNKANPFGSGGSSVASDHNNANLLFYTDGSNVYDLSHTRMPNGAGLNGNPSGNQPTAICAVPGQPGKYYIFTNNAAFPTGGTISRTVVDMTQFGNAGFPSPPFGDVATKNTAMASLTGQAEGMITVPHANGNDFWLITQTMNSQTFSATLIDGATFTSGTFNTVSSTTAQVPTSAAHLAYHQVLRKIAVAPQDPSTDAIILNFNATTGVISFDRTILNSGFPATGTQAIYDIEWSASGRYLYFSRIGEAGYPSNVFQYDYLSSSTTLAPVIGTPLFQSYGLQLAPDNFIYHLYQTTAGGSYLLGRITRPERVADSVGYDPAPFGATNFGGAQFPSFLPKDTIDLKLDFSTVGSCANSPTAFFPDVSPGADSLFWDFGDGEAGRGWGPLHTYTAGGTYDVRLTAFYQGEVDSVNKSVIIRDFPLQIQMTQDTTACRCEFPPPRGGAPANGCTLFSVKAQIQGGTPASIVWSNGDTGETLTPDSAGYYYVVITDVAGCTGYAAVNVREYDLQDQTFNKWYFGNKAGIDFNLTPPAALNESVMDAPEGCAIVCDRNGQTIFYTDGTSVWDRTHTLIETDIGGNPASTQSSMIVPVPDDETIYFIFTTQAINGTDSLQLSYSLFDLKQNSGVGAVVKKSVFLFARSTERITASGSWVIAHEYGNNTFRAYLMSPDGLGDAVYSSIGSDHSFTSKEHGEGYMKLGPRNLLAVPISTPGTSNHIELFDFIDSTGVVTNLRDINLNEPNGQIYGLEFSPAGNKLFATLKMGAASAIFEYSIDSVGTPDLKQRLPVSAALGAIQVGPDGQVYVATDNSGANASLGTIFVNEDTTATSGFNLAGFALASGTNSRLGLPNFIQSYASAMGDPNITVEGLCLGDSTRFSATPRDQIDEYNWRVFQGATVVATSSDATFAHLFSTPGTYSVALVLHNRCAPDTTMTDTFTITPLPMDPSRGVNLCNPRPAVLDANPLDVPGLRYLWTSGDTTETITVDEAMTRYVLVADQNSCFVIGQFLVADPLPVDLGPDLSICEDNNTPALDVGIQGMNYQWTINGAPASTISTQAVDTSLPGVYTYQVTVTDPVNNCTVTRDKVYTINVSPAFNFTGINPSGSCGNNNGSVTLDLIPSVPPGGPLYSYFISGPNSTAINAVDAPTPTSITVPGLRAGTYSVVVVDQISGCTLSSTTALSDPTVTAAGASMPPNCDPVVVQVTITGPVTGPLNWTATESSTLAVTSGTSGNVPPSPFNTTPLPAGDYSISVTDSSAPTPCTVTFNHVITPNPSPTVTFTPNLCARTLSASATGANTFTWTSNPPGGITGATTGATISLTPNAGQVTYTVIASGPGICPATDNTTLNVGALGTPTLAQSDGCQNTVIVSATPAVSGVVYRWYRNGALDNTLGGSQIILGLTDHDDVFATEIFEPQSGCTTGRSADLTAVVVGPIVATLGSTPPCDDDQPITLTATTTTTGVTYRWLLDGSVITGATTATLTDTREGEYSVEISKATCKVVGTLDIQRAPLPDGELPNRLVICNDPDNADPLTRSADLDPGAFTSYEWSKNNLLLNYTSRVYNADSEGTYSVELINAFSCVSVDETEILNECLPVVKAPNVFRPASNIINEVAPDLKNSEFWVISKFIEDDGFMVFIFNRWGEMVYSSTDRNFKWNGGYNNNMGQPLPPGTYSYVIKYVSSFRPDLGSQEQRGGVALLR
jgi:gliding motility-associated-like protein